MLMIRLQRVGRKNVPTFRVVLTDSKNSTKSGRFLEIMGAYDAREGGIKQVKADRIKHWLSVGAQASGTVHNLLISEKIITGKKVNVLPKKSPPKKEEEKVEEKAPAKEAPAAEAAPTETPAAA